MEARSNFASGALPMRSRKDTSVESTTSNLSASNLAQSRTPEQYIEEEVNKRTSRAFENRRPYICNPSYFKKLLHVEIRPI